jgi:hypothetical protein
MKTRASFAWSDAGASRIGVKENLSEVKNLATRPLPAVASFAWDTR